MTRWTLVPAIILAALVGLVVDASLYGYIVIAVALTAVGYGIEAIRGRS